MQPAPVPRASPRRSRSTSHRARALCTSCVLADWRSLSSRSMPSVNPSRGRGRLAPNPGRAVRPRHPGGSLSKSRHPLLLAKLSVAGRDGVSDVTDVTDFCVCTPVRASKKTTLKPPLKPPFPIYVLDIRHVIPYKEYVIPYKHVTANTCLCLTERPLRGRLLRGRPPETEARRPSAAPVVPPLRRLLPVRVRCRHA